MSLSSDGTKVAVGEPQNDGNGSNAGHVRVYEWNGSAWTQKGADIDGEAAGDQFGRSVSLSSDGTKVAVGAPANDGNGTNAGHVRVYSISTAAPTVPVPIRSFWLMLAGLLIPALAWRRHQTKRVNQCL